MDQGIFQNRVKKSKGTGNQARPKIDQLNIRIEHLYERKKDLRLIEVTNLPWVFYCFTLKHTQVWSACMSEIHTIASRVWGMHTNARHSFGSSTNLFQL